MLYINETDHQKFISLCKKLLDEEMAISNGNHFASEKMQQLQKDLTTLQTLAEDYKNTFSKLPKLSQNYKALQHNIRINLRKLQISKKLNSNKRA